MAYLLFILQLCHRKSLSVPLLMLLLPYGVAFPIFSHVVAYFLVRLCVLNDRLNVLSASIYPSAYLSSFLPSSLPLSILSFHFPIVCTTIFGEYSELSVVTL